MVGSPFNVFAGNGNGNNNNNNNNNGNGSPFDASNPYSLTNLGNMDKPWLGPGNNRTDPSYGAYGTSSYVNNGNPFYGGALNQNDNGGAYVTAPKPNYGGPFPQTTNSGSPFYNNMPGTGGSNMVSVDPRNPPIIQQDPYAALFEQLMSQINSPVSGPSMDDLLKQAQQQTNLKYDPLIRGLQDASNNAKTNEGVASQKVGDLYNSLGRSLAAQLPGITEQFGQAQDQARNNYATLQSQINSNYKGAQDAQAAELEKLGIQAALPQSTESLNRDQSYLSSQAGTNGQALNDFLTTAGVGQKDFMQRASAMAPQAGVNAQSDMAQKLLQLQNQYNQQIAGYQGDKGASVQALLSQLQGAASDSATKAQQARNNNLTSILTQLMGDQSRMNVANINNSSKTPKYSGSSGASAWLNDNAPQDAKELMDYINQYSTSKDRAGLSGPGGIGAPNEAQQYNLLLDIIKKSNPSFDPTSNKGMELLNALRVMNGTYQ